MFRNKPTRNVQLGCKSCAEKSTRQVRLFGASEMENGISDEERHRREFLKKLGRYGVVTPSVIASLMTHQNAHASSQLDASSDVVYRPRR